MNKYNFKEYNINNKIYVSMSEVVTSIGVAKNKIKAKHPLFNEYVIKEKIPTRGGEQIVNLIELKMLEIYIKSFIRAIDINKEGFIYIVKYADNVYKIGCTSNFEKRFKNLKTSYPFDLQMIKIFKTTNYYFIEQEIHKKYKEFLLRGKKEFFNLSDKKLKELIKEIDKRLYNQITIY